MSREITVADSAFGKLRDEIWVRSGGELAQVIAVVSARRGEGRTLTAAGLAQALGKGLPNERILLIDADLRRPSLHSVFGLELSPGLCDVLRGSCEAEAALQQAPDSSVILLPAGDGAEEACMLIASRRMTALMNDLRRRARVIILDCPPVESAVEAHALAEMADGVLLVVRADRTTQKEAADAATRLGGSEKGKLLGVVLNGVYLGAK